MEPKNDLVVFSKKEIFIIILLLVLVALFSFTLGLKIGRTLQEKKAEKTAELSHEHQDEHGDKEGPLHDDATQHAAAPAEHGEAEEGEEEAVTPKDEHHAPGAAEDHADQKLYEELKKEKLTTHKGPVTELPAKKKAEKAAQHAAPKVKETKHGETPPAADTGAKKKLQGVKFTLQVGSHRSETEAQAQVNELKSHDLEAFYIEVTIPKRGIWYRVGIGLFGTKEEAEAKAADWSKTKILPAFIIQKISE